MASYKVRRQLLATGGASIAGGTNLTSGLNVSSGSSVLGTATTNGTVFSSTGRQTMAGTARVRKDIWLPPEAFVAFPGNYGVSVGNSGSWIAASMNVVVTGSILAGSTGDGMAGSMIAIKVIQPEAKQAGSPITCFAKFPKPRDADTTGSITAYVEWTNTIANCATAGSTSVWRLGMAYFGSGSPIRSAASAGANEPYSASTTNIWMSSCIGNLPSFKASDSWAVFVLQNRMDSANDKLGSSAVAVAGVRLTYTACALGTASTE